MNILWGDVVYHLREFIRLSADLRNHYNEISKQCREENEAVIIIMNGCKDMELLEMLIEAEEDVTNGRIMPIQDTFHDLGSILKGKWNVYTEYIGGKTT